MTDLRHEVPSSSVHCTGEKGEKSSLISTTPRALERKKCQASAQVLQLKGHPSFVQIPPPSDQEAEEICMATFSLYLAVVLTTYSVVHHDSYLPLLRLSLLRQPHVLVP